MRWRGAVPTGEVTRFTRRRWRGRLGRWRAGLLLLAGSAVLGIGGWVVWFSGLLAVDEVRIQGTSVLSEQQVGRAAAVAAGTPLARVDLDTTADRVRALAPVADVQVSRDWPGAVVIVVSEREAVAVLQRGDGYRGLDGAGVVFRAYAEPPAGLPLVQADELAAATDEAPLAEQDALREVAAVVEALEGPVADRVDHVEVTSLDAITLVLGDGDVVRWGSAADSALKAEVLAALMRVPAATYDVSVPQLPTTSG
jgi:cell division protein FtsQ